MHIFTDNQEWILSSNEYNGNFLLSNEYDGNYLFVVTSLQADSIHNMTE
jgi:hypothetical protein